MMLGSVGEQIAGKPARLFLGYDTGSAAEYMESRIDRARSARIPSIPLRSESDEYGRFSEDEIAQGVDILDQRFVAQGSVLKSGWSRDREFRRLLRNDYK